MTIFSDSRMQPFFRLYSISSVGSGAYLSPSKLLEIWESKMEVLAGSGFMPGLDLYGIGTSQRVVQVAKRFIQTKYNETRITSERINKLAGYGQQYAGFKYKDVMLKLMSSYELTILEVLVFTSAWKEFRQDGLKEKNALLNLEREEQRAQAELGKQTIKNAMLNTREIQTLERKLIQLRERINKQREKVEDHQRILDEMERDERASAMKLEALKESAANQMTLDV